MHLLKSFQNRIIWSLSHSDFMIEKMGKIAEYYRNLQCVVKARVDKAKKTQTFKMERRQILSEYVKTSVARRTVPLRETKII